MSNNKVDIKENYIRDLDQELLLLLLLDQTTKKNLIWATDNYKAYGYMSYDYITVAAITGYRGCVIKPRIEKSKAEIQKRVKDKAEVFTPAWVCNAQNNLVDIAWFGYQPVFNVETNNHWDTIKTKISFPEGKTWQDYVKANRMEISCGEAPYLVSRYDSVSGEIIPLEDRIGLLDRKIRIINENVDSDEEWLEWVKWSFKSVYGYDWQGDNVLLARENLLFTFIDYYVARFGQHPSTKILLEIAEIISWNIWQMDGLKFVIPNSCHSQKPIQMSLFGDEPEEPCIGCVKNSIKQHNGIYCKIKDWTTGRANKLVNLIGRKS